MDLVEAMTDKKEYKQSAKKRGINEVLEVLERELEESNELTTSVYEGIRELGERELITNYRIVKYLLERFTETGKVDVFGRRDFLEFLPWEKSQLSKRLQRMAEEELLQFERRKYSLNVDNPFVKRVRESLRYQWEEYDLDRILHELIEERKGAPKRKEREEKIGKRQKRVLRKCTEEELLVFLEGIYDTYTELSYASTEEEVSEFIAKEIEENILLTIGLTSDEVK